MSNDQPNEFERLSATEAGPASQPELASGESATVAMDILEPATQIVGYDFGFR